ncbi:MAG: L-rhamnose mutarotase [Clostridia bacterium]|nr:L-rhamnose mutarotase [Clostridia bacterium]MBN2882016.1 L-rhamnose mutarotase [Clostridia bacterium]
MKKRYCLIIEVKEPYIEEYIKIHKEPWREMLEAIRDSGIDDEIIYFHKNQSIIFMECEDFEASNLKLRSTDVCKRWDDKLVPWFEDVDIAFPEKIFDLNQQLDGELLDY